MRRTDGSGSVTRRVLADGTVRYGVRLRINGERKSLGVYDTEAEARAVLSAALVQTGKVRGWTLRTWGDKWLDTRETSGLYRNAHKDRSTWKCRVMIAKFADWPIRKIKRTDIVNWTRDLQQTKARASHGGKRKPRRKLSHQSVLNALYLLSRALEDAADRGIVKFNPCRGVKVRKPPTTDTWTYLEQHEIEALLALPLRDEQRAFITLAIYTGLRPGEISGLHWSDVRLTGPKPHIMVRFSRKTAVKQNRAKEVPLIPPAIAALQGWKKIRPGVGRALVFPAKHGGCHGAGFDAGLPAALKAAGITRPGVTFKSLRHTCASHLLMGTWGRAWRLEEVQKVLRHRSITTTERYAHMSPETLHKAAAETVGEASK